MQPPQTQVVARKILRANLFVRRMLDQERVLCLAELIQNGIKMRDPITVARMHGGELWVVDGRHRLEAYELNDVTDVEVRFIEVDNEADFIAAAYKANVGGALPPRKEDTEHTITLLLEQRVPQKQIADLLGLPSSLARSYVSTIQSRMSRAKLQRAAQAIADEGLTIAKAAEVHGVDLEKLKEILSGRRRKHAPGIQDTKRTLTQMYKSMGSKQAALLRKLLVSFENGDVTQQQVREIFAHIERLQRKATRAVADRRQRHQHTNGTAAKTA